jgi:hypothetical protein
MRCSSSLRSTMATSPVAAIADIAEPSAKPRSTERRLAATWGLGSEASIRLRRRGGAV